ncbi:MAG: manganese transporter [Phycisphaeraceae bacterium]|nr:MAG: manganese transporter [Phycisphaeraceae bacterium]
MTRFTNCLTGIITCILLAVAVSLFSSTAAADDGRTIGVVATTSMIGDVASEVGGDRVRVFTIIGPGVDPHLYKPGRSDVARMLGADIVFYNGLLLEGKMTDALIRVARSGRPVYAVTELMDEDSLLSPEEFDGHFDPHVWMDPVAWSQAVDVIAAKLAELDPAGAPEYSRRAEAYKAELEKLDAYARQALSSVPEQSRVLVTAHDAFNYLGRRYDFEVLGVQGLSTESEAGVRDIENLVNMIVERRIPAVFAETTVPDRNVRALVSGARARGYTVALGPELFSDATGAAGTYEGTYIGMIDHNITAITRALGGEAPTGGMNGRLSLIKSESDGRRR